MTDSHADPPATIRSSSPAYYFITSMSDNQLHAIAGASAGLASGIVTCPLDVIKTKLQAQRNHVNLKNQSMYHGLVGTFRKIWHEEGIRGLYKGLGPICVGYLPTWAVYFTVYEKAKLVFEPCFTNTFMSHIVSAMSAGAASTIATNPIWVIKTRLMSQGHHTPWHYQSTLDAFRTMYRTEGIRAFYSGLSPALLGLAHVAVQFPLYEHFKVAFLQESPSSADWPAILLASALSKICASGATYPHEVVRTRLQTQSNKQNVDRKYRGIVNSFQTIYREEGWRAFYQGMGTNMFRAVPASAMTLLTYEMVMKSLEKAKYDGE